MFNNKRNMKRNLVDVNIHFVRTNSNMRHYARSLSAILNSYSTEMWFRHLYAHDLHAAAGKYLL